MSLYCLNGFLNGYNDKLSLNTEPNVSKRRAKSIKIDSFEYGRARANIDGGYQNPYDVYLDIKHKKRAKLRNIRHKVNDCLTSQDIISKCLTSNYS